MKTRIVLAASTATLLAAVAILYAQTPSAAPPATSPVSPAAGGPGGFGAGGGIPGAPAPVQPPAGAPYPAPGASPGAPAPVSPQPVGPPATGARPGAPPAAENMAPPVYRTFKARKPKPGESGPAVAAGIAPGGAPIAVPQPKYSPIISTRPLALEQPAPRTGQDVIRETKLKVFQKHYENALSEGIEMRKALAGAAPQERDALKAKIEALEEFTARLETDIGKLAAESPHAYVARPNATVAVAQPESPASYSAAQATGAPDSGDTGGDSPLAWCPQSAESDNEWLGLIFENTVEVAEIRIHETYATGALARVAAIERHAENGRPMREHGIASYQETVEKTPCVRVITMSPGVRANGVRLEFETRRINSWQEIDAVELVGRDGSRQWAKSAEASSHWGQARGPVYGIIGSGDGSGPIASLPGISAERAANREAAFAFQDAREDLERMKALHATGQTSAMQLVEAETRLRVAEANAAGDRVKAAAAARDGAEKRLKLIKEVFDAGIASREELTAAERELRDRDAKLEDAKAASGEGPRRK